ncbi:MAG: FecR domain-containing protein [Lunatimonas sp.]|uniref:FecR domain-containing protein n=1 Tax=Lunatimonas sp. TaxID=2060141 RepID=UPI00263B88F4|nr:FecR domain-containing protein [Lunatimonas sp.]MCC5937284.1 FecR domain-containing protein [Lunatimonas sp.]
METVNEEILIKYLLGECEPEEEQRIRRWLDQGPENRQKLETIHWIWRQSESLKNRSKIDPEQAWQRFLERKAAVKTPVTRFIWRGSWARVAASVCLALGLLWASSYLLPHQGKAYFGQVALEAPGAALEEVLLDGSKVTLNTGAKLAYSQPLFSRERKVWLLKGEAYFDVAHAADRPFVVHGNNLSIRVLGTEFHVRIADGDEEVILDRGSVQVESGENKLLLEPGETARMVAGQTLQKSRTISQLHKYYVTKHFVAEGTPLADLVATMSQAYGQAIRIRGTELEQTPISTTLPFESLQQNLEVLKETLGLEILKEGNLIILQ